MNENINLCEILKDCPKGTKLYSPLFGEVTLYEIIPEYAYSIQIKTQTGSIVVFNRYGIYNTTYVGADCLLFPSKDQRDWSKFKCHKPKFDPKTLQPFDKVLCRFDYDKAWQCNLYSHTYPKMDKVDYTFYCMAITYMHVIPYNDETKHLVGTTEEAPEFYRYWED